MNTNIKWRNWVYGIFVVALVILVLHPVIWIIFLALRPQSRMLTPFWTTPVIITFDNLKKVFRPEFLNSIKNSLTFAVFTTALSILIGAPAGFVLAQAKLRSKGVLLWLVVLLRLAPPIGFAIPLFLIYRKINLIDTMGGLVIAYLTATLPLTIWLLWKFFQELPKEIYEAGFSDGATVFDCFFRLAFPLVKPGILAAAVLSFSACWNDFFFALIMSRNKANTGTVAVVNFITETTIDWGGICSACIILILPSIPIAFFMQKYLASGIMSGSVKG